MPSSEVSKLTRIGIAPASPISILLSVLLLESERISLTAALRSSIDRLESLRTSDSIAAISPLTSRNVPSLLLTLPLVSAVGCSTLCVTHH